jgi:hypothetical protein
LTRRSQWLTLSVLLGIWAGVTLWVIAAAPDPPRVPLAHVTGKADRAKAGRPQAGAGLIVNLDLLTAARRRGEEAFVAPKNIFAPLSTERTVPTHAKPRAPATPPAPVVAVPVVPPPPSPEELAAQAARQELAQFRYLGYLSRDGREEAFLSKGKELYIVRSEETIEERVRVKTVTPTGVTLQETHSQVVRTVPLNEAK